MKEIIRIRRDVFDRRSKFLKLVALGGNRFLYKKRFKFKIKQLLRVIGMILWIPINIPYSLIVTLLIAITEWCVDMIDIFSGDGLKLYFEDIKAEFKAIRNCIFEIID